MTRKIPLIRQREMLLLPWLLLTCLAWTWPEEPGTLQLRGAVGFSTINFLSHVKGAGPTDPYSFSDLRMANGPAFLVGVQYYLTPWFSVGADATYAINSVKQQAVTACTAEAGCGQHSFIKGWNGKVITIASTILLHSPAWQGLHVYGGGGPTFTMSTLGDQFGNTESNDWGIGGRIGVQYAPFSAEQPWRLFMEWQHKQDYMDCGDKEGCFRGRRYGNLMLFGVAWNW